MEAHRCARLNKQGRHDIKSKHVVFLTNASRSTTQYPVYHQIAPFIPPISCLTILKIVKMLASSTSLSLFFISATLMQLCNAFPPFLHNTIAYLTNCQTSDTGAVYSEVSMYLDAAQSFNGQNPDQYEDTSLGQITTWEGVEITWFYAGGDPKIADEFTEFINANAQDPSVPISAQVGCARYVDGNGDMANYYNFKCYKDTPRVLYTTSDHECSTVYYCKVTNGAACPLPSESESSNDLICQNLC
jgi:hypothetical protein